MLDPAGTTVPLVEAKQLELNRLKRQVRITNELYFRAHPELNVMIKAFVNTLLDNKPDDVREAAQAFFTQPNLAQKLGMRGWTRPPSPKPPADLKPSPAAQVSALAADKGNLDKVEAKLLQLFSEADTDGSGSLQMEEFEQLMRTADLGLEEAELEQLLIEADSNRDGDIEYKEFVPLAVEVLQGMRLRASWREAEGKMSVELQKAVLEMCSGMQEEDFCRALREALGQVRESSDRLSRRQIRQGVQAPQLALSTTTAQMVTVHIKLDKDGKVAIEEAPRRIYEVLLKGISTQIFGAAMADASEVKASLIKAMAHLDTETTGRLRSQLVRQAIATGFPWLSRLQIASVMSEAEPDANGNIIWNDFVKTASVLLHAMMSPAAIEERHSVCLRAEFSPVELMQGKDATAISEMFDNLFREYDVDENGYLSVDEIEACLRSLALGLKPGEVMALRDVVDENKDGKISTAEFKKAAYDLLLFVARERAIAKAMGT